MGEGDQPLLPDYGGRVRLQRRARAARAESGGARRGCRRRRSRPTGSCSLVLDGLGWQQLQERRHLAPTLCGDGRRPDPRRSLPTTTATALTSLSTGATPGDHGVVGYRISVRRRGAQRPAVDDAPRRRPRRRSRRRSSRPCRRSPGTGRRSSPGPSSPRPASPPPTSTASGSGAGGCRRRSSPRSPASPRAGEPFVYAYYDGVDKVSHEYGLGEHYDAELAAADRLVADCSTPSPAGTAVVVTADHGQVHTGTDVAAPRRRGAVPRELPVGRGPLPVAARPPGPRRRRCSRPPPAPTATGAWVRTRDELVAEGWFGPRVGSDAARPASATSPSSPEGTVAFTRADRHRARTTSSGGTARPPPPRSTCRLLVGSRSLAR